MNAPKAGSMTHQKIAVAISKTGKVQRDVQEAGALLSESTETLLGPLNDVEAAEAIHAAVEKNENAEEKLHEAGDELKTVKALLKDAEEELNRRTGKSGTGAESIIPHLSAGR